MSDIRFATLNDAGRILEIYLPHIIETPVSFEAAVPSLEEFRERMRETMVKFPWLLYECEGRVLGYAYACSHRSRCAYEWSVESTVYVDTDHYGKHIGTKLYRELFRLLKVQGVVNVFAGITQPNEASVRLHESLGFSLIGRFKDVGFKLGQWWDVGWWQLQLQKPEKPNALLLPGTNL